MIGQPNPARAAKPARFPGFQSLGAAMTAAGGRALLVPVAGADARCVADLVGAHFLRLIHGFRLPFNYLYGTLIIPFTV